MERFTSRLARMKRTKQVREKIQKARQHKKRMADLKNHWFHSMHPDKKKEYLASHPNSMYHSKKRRVVKPKRRTGLL